MNTVSVLPVVSSAEVKPLKPLGLFQSLFFFGIPAAALAFGIYGLWPLLMDAGMSRASAYVLGLSSVNALLLVAAVAAYLLEGNPMTWSAFSARMRLKPLTGRVWLWTLVGTLGFGILALLVNSLAAFTYKTLNFSMPDLTPGIMTVWMHAVVLFFNIVGEELWWRGYILPRQELAFGKSTWAIHGVLWAWFHIFKWWAVPFMMVTCLVIPFVAQRTRNSWPGMINHLVINGVGVILGALS